MSDAHSSPIRIHNSGTNLAKQALAEQEKSKWPMPEGTILAGAGRRGGALVIDMTLLLAILAIATRGRIFNAWNIRLIPSFDVHYWIAMVIGQPQ